MQGRHSTLLGAYRSAMKRQAEAQLHDAKPAKRRIRGKQPMQPVMWPQESHEVPPHELNINQILQLIWLFAFGQTHTKTPQKRQAADTERFLKRPRTARDSEEEKQTLQPPSAEISASLDPPALKRVKEDKQTTCPEMLPGEEAVGPGTGHNRSLQPVTLESKACEESRESRTCSALAQSTRFVKIGHGAYGQVFKFLTKSGALQAVKQMPVEVAERELGVLQSLRGQPNIVRLQGSKDKAGLSYLMLEYAPHDLTGYLHFRREAGRCLTLPEQKCLGLQLSRALQQCHKHNILHRDLKPRNILLKLDGTLKLCDFGMADYFEQKEPLRPRTLPVVTLWYRPPELLLGCEIYGPEIDIWAAGVIIAELLLGQPLFPLSSELDVLRAIAGFFAVGERLAWPGSLQALEGFARLRERLQAVSARKTIADFQTQGLLQGTLNLDPKLRSSATSLADHTFWVGACQPNELFMLADECNELRLRSA